MADDKMVDLGKYVLDNPIRHLYAGLGAVELLVIEGISQFSRNNFDLSDLAFMTLTGTVIGYGIGAVMDIGKYISEKMFERKFKYSI